MTPARSVVHGTLAILATALAMTGTPAAGVAQVAPAPVAPTHISASLMAEPAHSFLPQQPCTVTGLLGTHRFDLSDTPLAGQRIDGTYTIHRVAPPGSGQPPLYVGTFTIRCAR